MTPLIKFALLSLTLMVAVADETDNLPFLTGGVPATGQLHACVVQITVEGGYKIASGSVVSLRHVVTSQELAILANGIASNVLVVYFPVSFTDRADASPTFVFGHPAYDPDTGANDIAVLQFAPETFPAGIFIPLDFTSTGPDAFVVGFGFSDPLSDVPSKIPNVGGQTVGACSMDGADSESHICGTLSSIALCSGDNGAGLFVEAEGGSPRGLIGVASRILPGCRIGTETAFTSIMAHEEFLSSFAGILVIPDDDPADDEPTDDEPTDDDPTDDEPTDDEPTDDEPTDDEPTDDDPTDDEPTDEDPTDDDPTDDEPTDDEPTDDDPADDDPADDEPTDDEPTDDDPADDDPTDDEPTDDDPTDD